MYIFLTNVLQNLRKRISAKLLDFFFFFFFFFLLLIILFQKQHHITYIGIIHFTIHKF